MGSANERRPFLLRLDPATMAALKGWAAEDLRSLNGQIEYLLRGALRDAGRLPSKARGGRPDADAEPDAEPDGSSPRGTPDQRRSRLRTDHEPAPPERVAG